MLRLVCYHANIMHCVIAASFILEILKPVNEMGDLSPDDVEIIGQTAKLNGVEIIPSERNFGEFEGFLCANLHYMAILIKYILSMQTGE